MTKYTPVVDGRDVMLRDKYRAMVSDYSTEVVSILNTLKAGDHRYSAQLVKAIKDLEHARQLLLSVEAKVSNETHKSDRPGADQHIDFDAMRLSIGRRLDRLRSAQGPRGVPE